MLWEGHSYSHLVGVCVCVCVCALLKTMLHHHDRGLSLQAGNLWEGDAPSLCEERRGGSLL